ncbi:uncharacterized protein LOC136032404 [Artemia franciscana]|uniref:uncharacterized protein LOC136032404 n=1 Tax=Artemia franciscana TaxID=6661 RepID=UPI0032DB50EA
MMLIDFEMANDLVIGGNLFPHRDVHKYSWTSPGGAVRNQIDHCLVSRKFRSSIQDVRAYRGADVGSDHNMLVTKFSLKLKRNEKKAPNSEPQFDSDKLLDRTTRHEFVTELSNKFEALYISDQDDQEIIWDQIKNLYIESASKTLGNRKKPKDQWLSDRTWQLIEERKVAKLQILACPDANQIYKIENYRRIDKAVKKSARRDKRHFYEAKAMIAEEVAKNGDCRSLYKITDKIIEKKRASDGPVKNENGILVTGHEDEKILNRPPPDEPISILEDLKISLDINTEPPTEDELLKAVKKLKNGRSPGDGRITAEMLKCTMDTCVTYWKDFFGTIWTTAKLP